MTAAAGALRRLAGGGLFARALRGAGWTALGFGAAQILRLASNLILTRLLFPEAFGLMALVSIFLVGLAMFSDLGIGPSIMQNARGDDPDFLDTAWTLQAMRGGVLWLATWALALPAASFYDAPQLAALLPAAGLSLLIAGFNPTRIDTANRHLLLGRVTVLDLAGQAIGVVALVILAWATRSVWALVIGAIVGAAAKLALMRLFLPGAPNRFRWEPRAAREIIRFGKWIFLSTALGFMVAQGDRAVLGKYLSLEMLGIYSIGYFLASAPLLLGGAVTGRILIPLYRDSPPSGAPANFAKLRRLRFGLTAGILSLVLAMAWAGPSLVALLYDARYQAAGAIVTAIALVQIGQVIGMTYDQSALAAGDSRGYFMLFAARATLQISFFLIGVSTAGLLGALVGQGAAILLIHPLIVLLARRHGAWDPLHDAVFALIGLIFGGLAYLAARDAIAALAGIG